MIQVFGERYQDGQLPPHNKPVKGAVGQACARLGGVGPRKDSHGGIYFQIQRQIKAYKKGDAPPKHVKPVPIIIFIFITAQAFGDTRSEEEMAIADMIAIVFFFLLRPGEYTGTVSDDAASKLQDVSLCIQGRK
jgi:hypothetical protein